MAIIAWVLLGLVAGIIGSKIMNNTQSGLVLDSILGVAGAVVGGIVFQMIGFHRVTGLNLWSLFVAVIGSVIVLGGYHFVAQLRTRS